MDRDETARVLGLAPESVRIRPTGLRRRLRRQARPLGAAAAGGRGLELAPAGAHGLHARRVDGLHRPSAIRRRSAPAPRRDARGPAPRLRDARPISTPAPTPPGGRRSPTACRCMPCGPYRVPNVADRDARDLHQRPAGRRLPRLRRAAGGDRPRDADGRPRRARSASTAGLPPPERAAAAATRTPPGQVLAHSAGLPQCLEALQADWTAALARRRGLQRRRAAPRRGVGIACMWYGCGNTSLPNPSTHAHRLARDGTLTLLQRRRRHRPGLEHGARRRSPPMRSACRVGAVPRSSSATPTSRRTPARPPPRARPSSPATPPSSPAGTCAGRSCASPMPARERGAGARGRDARRSRDGDVRRRVDLGALAGRRAAATSSRAEGTYDPPTTPLDADGQGVPYADLRLRARRSPRSRSTSTSAR